MGKARRKFWLCLEKKTVENSRKLNKVKAEPEVIPKGRDLL